jgi:hypothetical protein
MYLQRSFLYREPSALMYKNLVRNHSLAIGLAFVVGFVYLLPNVLFIIEAGKDYHYPFLAMPDERHYASRIREIYDGHYAIANPDLKEYKGSPYFWQPLSEIIVGCVGKLLGIRIENLLVLSDFVFPFILFLVIYCFGYCLTRGKSLSVLGTCAIMMISIVIFGPPQSLIYWMVPLSLFNVNPLLNPKSSFLFTRSINPQFNLILFFICMIGVYGTVFRKEKIYLFLGGIIIGGLFYVSFFYWSYVIAGCGIFGFYSLLKRDVKTFGKLVMIIIGGAILSIPYWVGVSELSTSPIYDEVIKRCMVQFSHKPYLVKLELLGIFVFLLFCPKKDRSYVFLASFLLGGIICENQHILTGKRIAPYHWSLYCQAPLMWVGLVLMGSSGAERWVGIKLIRRIKQKRKCWTVALSVFMVFNGIHTQVVYTYATDREKGPRSFYENSLRTWLEYQKLEPALNWLNRYAERDSVVLASTWTSELVTTFTHCNILVGWHTQVYLVSDRELWERWLLKCCFFGVPDDQVWDVLEPNLDGIWHFCPWLLHEEAESPALLQWVGNLYSKTKLKGIQEMLSEYEVEYVLYSKSEREEYLTDKTGFDIFGYPFLAPVVETGDVSLFRVTIR